MGNQEKSQKMKTVGPEADFPTPLPSSVPEETASAGDEKSVQPVLTSESILLQIEGLKVLIENLEADLRFRFPVAENEKRPPKAHQEAQRCLGLLVGVETALAKQLQRFCKRLDKADGVLAGLRGQGLKEIKEGLKQTRKDLEKILVD